MNQISQRCEKRRNRRSLILLAGMLAADPDIAATVITHRFPWQDFEQGFEVMRSGNSGKVILDWRNMN